MPKICAADIEFNYQYLAHNPLSTESSKNTYTMVYIHGLVMDNLSSAYFTFAHRVSKVCNVLLYDLRGHGKTQISATGYSIDEQVNDLHVLLKALQINTSLHIVGCSFGGVLALAYAKRYSQQVASLTLLDAHQHKAKFLSQLQLDLQKEGDERDHLIQHHFQHWLHRDKTRKRKRLAERAQHLIYQTSLLKDLKTSSTKLHHHNEVDLKLKAVPILGIYGASSDALQDIKEFQIQYPHMQLKVFTQASHAVLWEETEAVTQAIEHWLQLHCT